MWCVRHIFYSRAVRNNRAPFAHKIKCRAGGRHPYMSAVLHALITDINTRYYRKFFLWLFQVLVLVDFACERNVWSNCVVTDWFCGLTQFTDISTQLDNKPLTFVALTERIKNTWMHMEEQVLDNNTEINKDACNYPASVSFSCLVH